ncbi:hypothetical protein OUZ56_011315 [Daphnia magna]|uniref:Uncharacterized protein n=1 Tax=Daphnia magna TaxID=35525 RepID=A0ABQ9Z116_9CRUS|nr:hypothetical protein OUZ56_011315 [Daphnia magna]
MTNVIWETIFYVRPLQPLEQRNSVEFELNWWSHTHRQITVKIRLHFKMKSEFNTIAGTFVRVGELIYCNSIPSCNCADKLQKTSYMFLHTEQQLLSFKRVTIGTLKNEIFLFFLNLHAQEEQKEKGKLSFISPVIY